MRYPVIIQGGMGIAVSDWRLARAVSLLGDLGTVSGTGLATILARRLQAGDQTGEMRRAPVPTNGARRREGGASCPPPAAPSRLALPLYCAGVI